MRPRDQLEAREGKGRIWEAREMQPHQLRPGTSRKGEGCESVGKGEISSGKLSWKVWKSQTKVFREKMNTQPCELPQV